MQRQLQKEREYRTKEAVGQQEQLARLRKEIASLESALHRAEQAQLESMTRSTDDVDSHQTRTSSLRVIPSFLRMKQFSL